MIAKRIFICFLILLLVIYPASAGDASLNRWVLNVTLHDDGLVEEVIQAEIENSGSLPLEGISFVVPASGITVIYDFDHTTSFTGLDVEQQTVPDGVKVTVNFNQSIEAGKKWDGRIGFTAEKWAKKDGSDYSIDIPIEAPQAIVSGKNTPVTISADADVRAQVFFPRSVEVTNVTPKPFRVLFQYDYMVPTWTSDKLHTGDVIHVKGSYSDTLDKIVKTDEKSRNLSARIKAAKAQGIDTKEAEGHLANATNYNTDQALGEFWKNEDSEALKFAGYANDELKLAETSLSSSTVPKQIPVSNNKQTPGFAAQALVLILAIAFLVSRRK